MMNDDFQPQAGPYYSEGQILGKASKTQGSPGSFVVKIPSKKGYKYQIVRPSVPQRATPSNSEGWSKNRNSF